MTNVCPNTSSERFNCVCGKPQGKKVAICCDRCNEWLHCRCVGLTASQAKTLDEFICPTCIAIPPLRSLPDFNPAQKPIFKWGKLDGPTVCQKVLDCYKEAVHWRRNLLDVPSNRCGRAFTSELTQLFNSFAEQSPRESIALTAAMLFPMLILQKPNGKLKNKTVNAIIQRRLDLWADGDFDSLLLEGRTIQS